LSCLVGLLSMAAASQVSAQSAPAGTFETRILLGPEGETLPIATYEDVAQFLASASERSVKMLSRGITGATRLSLEDGGIEARAIFHDVNQIERKPKRLPNGRTVMYLRDSYTSQVAAYQLSRLLGMRNVPPTVVRVSGAATGSAQLWIEKAMTLWNQTLADMRIFDNLINNIDRNQGNMLVDSFGNLWLIDHTRSFGQDSVLPLPEMITRCSRRMLEAIRSLDEKTLRQDLEPYLTAAEIKALWHRRERVLARIEETASKLGEDWVLFDYGDPDPGVSVEQEEGSSGQG